MKIILLLASVAVIATASLTYAAADFTAARYVKATELPSAPDPSFEFRKCITQFYDRALEASRAKSRKRLDNTYLDFEKRRLLRGAITPEDFRQRQGNYFSLFWRAKRQADITVRFEYRQANLGSHVQAQEVHYPNARGSHRTRFAILGDDYLNDGRVIAWRALLIENGRIVASTQSYLWK